MADEIIEETQTEGTTEIPSEGTTGNGYLTKPYLVKNLQTFWGKIKQYIANQKFVNESYVDGALLNTASKEALASLTNTVNNKVSQDELTEKLAGKVDAVSGKGLSKNDFTDVLKDKLDQLPDSAATHSNMGFMSGDDKQQLDRLVANAITTADSALSATSENPVQNKIINEALNGKVDKETLDPSTFFNQDFLPVESFTGDIVFTPRNTIKHIKLHTEKGEIIEKFYISGKDDSDQTEVFNTFENSDLEIRIPNPDGTEKPANAVYKFYVECLEFSDSGKYKPFILRVKRSTANPITLILTIFES